ncbi:MAG: RNA helicase [Candidatus Muproteobacteria bacterium RBG_16_65_34]|uniref:ATP-dependent RNA helicase RhlB n=1 Tax=Candidatus Muproteobacteria bacterium RBG_16_65_34 TaxID=1817760 RepID=A0A1F6TNM7_9PROT|nr:MAG: RNA helicase [Candidatus Muproteobacteria bacterium RBG_16_65_34]
MSEHHLTDKSFSSFGLPDVLLKGVQDAGFEYCTPIQAEALPLALAGQDVAGQAQTGTGKTAAFLLAAFNHLLKHSAEDIRPNQPRAVMLAPTRELAVQIHKDAVLLGAHTGLRLGVVFGGTGYDTQRKMLEDGVDVLIGTPGRLIDYFKQRVFDLTAVQVLVLDEADRMFDLGFIKDIRFVLRRMPPPAERLSMLFSATLSYRVTELAYEHMNNPQFVRIEPDKRTADKVSQRLYHTAVEEKIPLLVGLLRHMDPTRSLVFINTKDMAERVAAWLKTNGLNAAVLSGDVPQTVRLRLLADFTEGRLPILVATDVAARGLHIPDVSHVFNFDLPQNAEDYVHRIGRTARAGASGDAVSFACERHVFSLPEIETYLGHKIPVVQVTPELLPPLKPPPRSERTEHRGERGRHRRGERRPEGGRRSERKWEGARPHAEKPATPPPPAAATPRPQPPAPKPQTLAPKPDVKPLARRGDDKPTIG